MRQFFIGLVTHKRSRYPESSGDAGLARNLAHALEELQIPTTLRVEDRDLAADEIVVTSGDLPKSRQSLTRTQRAWGAYLRQGSRSNPLRGAFAEIVLRGRCALGMIEPHDLAGVYRLLNIELAHLSLMESALEASADFTLILEDDASCSSIPELAANLAAMMERELPPYLIDLSSSFTPKQIGVEHLLEVTDLTWPDGGLEFRAVRPISNTVCAVGYRGDFLAQLVARWRAQELVPVIPVDWRFNELLMMLQAEDSLPSGCSALVYPGPIVQRSLHPR